MSSSKRQPTTSLRDASAKRNGPTEKADLSTHKVRITFFENQSASNMTREELTLAELGERITSTSAPTKARLPWLKGATFGSKRSRHGSLRNNGNVLNFSMIHLDYDKQEISPENGVERLKKAGFAGMIYSSPSHFVDRPRWRVLLPCSTNLPPEEHEGLARAAAAQFDAVFGEESFILSQSFFFGTAHKIERDEGEWVDGTPATTHIVGGNFVDRSGLPPWEAPPRPAREIGRAHV